MLKDFERATMSASSKTQSTGTPPVLLCRLCHCEFTNFKEHVKSLVHLDARETKTTLTPNQPTKKKGEFEDNNVIAKKAKTDTESDQNCTKKTSDKDNKTSETKTTTSQANKADSSFAPKVESPLLSEKKVDVNGTSTLKTNDVPENSNEAAENSTLATECCEELIPKEIFLPNHWNCKLCGVVKHIEDGSFDEHAKVEAHKEILARKLTQKNNIQRKMNSPWLLTCMACAFGTNDKNQYISHLQTALHDENVIHTESSLKKSVGKIGPEIKSGNANRKSKNKKTEEVGKIEASQTIKALSSSEQNTNPKSVLSQADANKGSSSGKPNPGRITLGTGNPARSAKQHPSKTNPKPLMSLSLPESWNKSKQGWSSASANTSNQNPSNKPGLLGEYRPGLLGINRFNRDDRFGRSTDSRASGADRKDSSLISRVGLSAPVKIPSYSEVQRDPISATSVRAFEDSYSSLLGPGRFDSVWSGQSSLASPSEKLNSLAFGRLEQESASRQYDILANLLTSQSTGLLPSNVSLDLASNSSFRFKHTSDREAMFDNISSRSDFSRTDFSRNDLSRSEFSRHDLSRIGSSSTDPHFRSMYTRR